MFEIADSDLLAEFWSPVGDNVITVEKQGIGTAFAWVSAVVRLGSQAEMVCLIDVSGEFCEGSDLCRGGYTFEPFSEDAEFSDALVERTVVRAVPYRDGVLPASFDVELLPDGAAELCVEKNRAPVLMGSSSFGQLFEIDIETGAGTLVGMLPAGATEIEYNELSGRGFMQERDGAFSGFEIDMRNGQLLGPRIFDGGSFNGLEYVGSELFGTVVYRSRGASELRILSLPSGESTLIGPTGRGPISGLAYDEATGTLYGIDGGPGPAELLSIDMTTGLASPIGSTGFQAGSLEFGPGGMLYGGGTGGNGGNLYRIDPETGASELIGATGFGSVTGLALAESLLDFDCAHFVAQEARNLTINGAPCISVDIIPGSETNPINLKRSGVLPVAILGSDELDIRDVDASTLAFGPGAARPEHRIGGHRDDVDDDGWEDLVSHYRTQSCGIAIGDVRACVTGELLDGRSFDSCDAISTLGIPSSRGRRRK
jgi:hypothetical protein